MSRKLEALERRKPRVRRALRAAANGRPRLSVFRSSKQNYVQVIDDVAGKTLAAASSIDKALKLSLGYSHDIEYAIPTGITIATPKPTEITISGINRQQVGQVAAEIRDYRGPEPYKGKGVKYAGEFIFRKEGKKK
jgi:ribosomal protein L18